MRFASLMLLQFCFVISAMGQSQSTMRGDQAPNLYPRVRVERICQHIQEMWRCRISGDITSQVLMLADSDPWVRAYVLHQLTVDTTFVKSWRAAGLTQLAPWHASTALATHVDNFVAWAEDAKGELRYRDGLPREVRQRGKPISRQEALRRMVYFAGQELRAGNRGAADLLVALMDGQPPREQARALCTLIPRTEFDHTQKDLVRLHPNGEVDAEFVDDIKARFLAWWEDNKDTYVPENAPLPEPR